MLPVLRNAPWTRPTFEIYLHKIFIVHAGLQCGEIWEHRNQRFGWFEASWRQKSLGLWIWGEGALPWLVCRVSESMTLVGRIRSRLKIISSFNSSASDLPCASHHTLTGHAGIAWTCCACTTSWTSVGIGWMHWTLVWRKPCVAKPPCRRQWKAPNSYWSSRCGWGWVAKVWGNSVKKYEKIMKKSRWTDNCSNLWI